MRTVYAEGLWRGLTRCKTEMEGDGVNNHHLEDDDVMFVGEFNGDVVIIGEVWPESESEDGGEVIVLSSDEEEVNGAVADAEC